jgi:hypothetical protein
MAQEIVGLRATCTLTPGLDPNIRTMFFDSMKEEKKEKEKEGGL